MATAIMALTVVDVLMTSYGLRLGVIEEANPIMARMFEIHPIVAVIAALCLTGAGLMVLYRVKSRLAKGGLWSILAVRVGIIFLHVFWVTSYTLQLR